MHHLNWQNRVPGKVKGKNGRSFLSFDRFSVDGQQNIEIFQTSCPENRIHIEIESGYDKFGF